MARFDFTAHGKPAGLRSPLLRLKPESWNKTNFSTLATAEQGEQVHFYTSSYLLVPTCWSLRYSKLGLIGLHPSFYDFRLWSPLWTISGWDQTSVDPASQHLVGVLIVTCCIEVCKALFIPAHDSEKNQASKHLPLSLCLSFHSYTYSHIDMNVYIHR